MDNDFLYRIWQVQDRTPVRSGDPENGPRCPVCRTYGCSSYCPNSRAYAILYGMDVPAGLYLVPAYVFFECQQPIVL